MWNSFGTRQSLKTYILTNWENLAYLVYHHHQQGTSCNFLFFIHISFLYDINVHYIILMGQSFLWPGNTTVTSCTREHRWTERHTNTHTYTRGVSSHRQVLSGDLLRSFTLNICRSRTNETFFFPTAFHHHHQHCYCDCTHL